MWRGLERCDVSPKNESFPCYDSKNRVNPYPRGSMCWKNEPWDMCAFGIFDPAASVKETCKLYRYKDTDDGSYLESYTTMGQLLSEDYAIPSGTDSQSLRVAGHVLLLKTKLIQTANSRETERRTSRCRRVRFKARATQKRRALRTMMRASQSALANRLGTWFSQ